MQQFYLHKLFDLSSDAEFLPQIPSDPVASMLKLQAQSVYGKSNMTTFYEQKARTEQYPNFQEKRSEYVQYKSGYNG